MPVGATKENLFSFVVTEGKSDEQLSCELIHARRSMGNDRNRHVDTFHFGYSQKNVIAHRKNLPFCIKSHKCVQWLHKRKEGLLLHKPSLMAVVGRTLSPEATSPVKIALADDEPPDEDRRQHPTVECLTVLEHWFPSLLVTDGAYDTPYLFLCQTLNS